MKPALKPAEWVGRFDETTLRRVLLAIALVGLATGLAAEHGDLHGIEPGVAWTAATVPVIAALVVSIARDFWMGRFGVDAIALVSMSAAVAFGEQLAAVVVAIMYAGGTVLEDFARGRAERNLAALTDRAPRTAHRRNGGAIETIAVDEAAVGDELQVRAGELVPVDGLLLDDEAMLDESAVTGEPLPERRHRGDALRSGTVNAGETFAMRASARAERSTYAAILQMVAAARTRKAPFIRLADRFAVFMLPATLALAAAAWYVSRDPVRALAVLVVATPCPLILAAPVAFVGGISRAARAGILMKGSAALEALSGIRTAVFDKTGTLTHGGAELLDAEFAPGRDPDELLRLIGSLEQASHHIVAESLVRLARAKGLALSWPTAVREFRGSGLRGIVEGIRVEVGSRALVLGDQPLPVWAVAGEMRFRREPVLRVFVSVDKRLAAVLTLGDSLRGDAGLVVSGLRRTGVSRLVMLTGDDRATAERIARGLALDQIVADASPADKVAIVEKEKAAAPTMMIGDGINDAPALATATVGVALGARGATASSEAADVIILANRLLPVADAIAIAVRTRAIAWQSIVAGLAMSGAAMIAAAMGLIAPVAGALLQEAIDVAVILNALRALGGGHNVEPAAATGLRP